MPYQYMASTLTVLVTNLVPVETLTISLMEIRPLNPVTACHPQVQETVGAILSGPPVKVGLVLYSCSIINYSSMNAHPSVNFSKLSPVHDILTWQATRQFVVENPKGENDPLQIER